MGKIRGTNNWEMKLTFQFLFVGSASNNLVNNKNIQVIDTLLFVVIVYTMCLNISLVFLFCRNLANFTFQIKI